MLDAQVAEFREALVARCPDHVGIDVTHLGGFRVKVVATTRDGHVSTIVLSVAEEHLPGHWARDVAKQLYTVISA